MINENDRRRIRNDAYIAKDAIESIIYAPTLHPSYIAEKVRVIENCINFIKLFAEEENEQ